MDKTKSYEQQYWDAESAAKEMDKLRALIAMQAEALKECRAFIKCEEIPSHEALQAIERVLDDTQATAEAYETAIVERCISAIEESQPPETTPWNCVDAIRKKMFCAQNAQKKGGE